MLRFFAAILIPLSLAAQGLWETRAPLPVAATEVSSAALDGMIYTTCGLSRIGHPAGLYIYDPRTDRWSEGAPNPIVGGADHCNLAAAGGAIYLLGAIRIGSSFVDGNTYRYDPRTDRWSNVGRMSTPRGASGVAVIGSRIYVAGGLAAGASVAAFEAFDTAANTWTTLPSMPTARDHLTAQAAGGKLYAIAGRSGRDLTANEEYDPATNAWRARAPIPTARGGLASGVIRDRIVVFGGEGNSGTPQNTFRQNEEYDPASDTWRSLAPMITPRHGFYGASLDGRIFAAGGGPIAGATFSNAHEVFYLTPAARPAISAVLNAASFDSRLSASGIASLFGTGLSQGEAAAAGTPLPARLNAVEVRINGAPAPLYYAGPAQINFVTPASLGDTPAEIVVSNAGVTSDPVRATIRAGEPALFSLDQSGRGQGAILIAGTGLIARATRDAFSRAPRRGEVVEIYGTGATAADAVFLGGARAEILFAGPHSLYPGLSQINARVPANAATGIAVEVYLQSGERRSNTVTMAVIE